MLSIKDIVELAKAGYKVADVKELLDLSKVETDIKEDSSIVADEKIDTISVTTSEIEDDKPEIDYKKLYEDTKKELETAQKKNINKDISNTEDDISDTDILTNLFKEFM